MKPGRKTGHERVVERISHPTNDTSCNAVWQVVQPNPKTSRILVNQEKPDLLEMDI